MMKAIILTEGGKNIGLGHISRCLSLYQGFEERGLNPEFIVNGDKTVLSWLKGKNFKIVNWLNRKERLFSTLRGTDIVVIDSYLADYSFYKKVSWLVKLPVYLDTRKLRYPRGIVVNGNLYAEDLKYPQIKDVIYLRGPEYTMLRKEFWQVPKKKIRQNVKSVMITFGGSDNTDLTPKILKFLNENYSRLIKNVIIGSAFCNIKHIESLKSDKTNLIYYPDAKGIKGVMLKSDIAVSSGGRTSYELARIGLPAIGISAAADQRRNLEKWQKIGFIGYIQSHNDKEMFAKLNSAIRRLLPYKERVRRSTIGKDIIDGKGASRICRIILEKTKVLMGAENV